VLATMGKITKTQRRLKHKAVSNISTETRHQTGRIGKPQKSKKHKKIKDRDPIKEAGDHTKRYKDIRQCRVL